MHAAARSFESAPWPARRPVRLCDSFGRAWRGPLAGRRPVRPGPCMYCAASSLDLDWTDADRDAREAGMGLNSDVLGLRLPVHMCDVLVSWSTAI